ncbi:hypothetical protein [Paraburkholderia adhaesiva]|uniref:hypothetical protein n=1 Tax=Paraburkholderia adhaesiva TaxID=2883244 RepID=UPI001F242FF7|nr:hypothetical protein [Paraburkholderia adhaesiva]
MRGVQKISTRVAGIGKPKLDLAALLAFPVLFTIQAPAVLVASETIDHLPFAVSMKAEA